MRRDPSILKSYGSHTDNPIKKNQSTSLLLEYGAFPQSSISCDRHFQKITPVTSCWLKSIIARMQKWVWRSCAFATTGRERSNLNLHLCLAQKHPQGTMLKENECNGKQDWKELFNARFLPNKVGFLHCYSCFLFILLFLKMFYLLLLISYY